MRDGSIGGATALEQLPPIPAGVHRLPRRFLASLVALAGIMNIASALLVVEPTRARLLHEMVPLEVSSTSRLVTVVAGLALLVLSNGLLRGKKTAWGVTLILLSASLASHMLKGLDAEEAAVTAVIIGFLVSARRQFRADSDPPTLRSGLLTLVVAFAGTIVYGVVGYTLLRHDFKVQLDLGAKIQAAAGRFFLGSGPDPAPITHHGHWFVDSIDVIGFLAMSYGLLAILRPVVWRRTVGREEHERARRHVERHARSAVARFALLPDKALHFAPGDIGFIAFRPIESVALALGDPIAPPERVAAAISSFVERCERSDWQPAFYQVTDETRPAFREAGFHHLKIGEEAVIPLSCFTLEGAHWRHERNLLRQMERRGISVAIHPPPHRPDFLARLKPVSDEWLAARRGGEKSFSLGRFDHEYLGDTSIAVATNPEHRVLAFANLVSEYGRGGYAVDLMRHLTAERGIMDYLLLQTAVLLRESGCATLNLGLAPLSGVGQGDAASIPERAVNFLYEHLNRFYSFRGLRAYKEKFRPEWEPRYLAYLRLRDLPRIGVALVRADSGENLMSYLRRG